MISCYRSPSIHSSYNSDPSYSSYGPPPIHYETITSYEPESIHYKEPHTPYRQSYYPEPEYKPEQHAPNKPTYYPTRQYKPDSKPKYSSNPDHNYKREYHQQPEYISKPYVTQNEYKPSHSARDPKPGKGFHKLNSYHSNEIHDEYGINGNKNPYDYDITTYNEVSKNQENTYDTRPNNIKDYHKPKKIHIQNNEYKRKSKYITVKPKTQLTETTTQYRLLTTTPFRYIISESENMDRIKSGNGIEFNNGWKPSFVPSEFLGSVNAGSQVVVMTPKTPLQADGFTKLDTELPGKEEAYDQFQEQITTFLTHDPYKSNIENVYEEPGPPYKNPFANNYNIEKNDYYDNEDYYEHEYYEENYSDYESEEREINDQVSNASRAKNDGKQNKSPHSARKYINYDPRKTKHEVVKKMSHEIGNDYPHLNSQQDEIGIGKRKEESELITDLKQDIHDRDYTDYRPHNSYNNLIYSPPYARADLLTTNPHKDHVYVQTLNEVIHPENVVEFAGVSIDQAGDSMKRTMDNFEDTPIINNQDNGVESDVANENDNINSESDKVVVVTPIAMIQTMDENEYEKLSNGLKLNDIHDFTYNGLNLEQKIYKNIVNHI